MTCRIISDEELISAAALVRTPMLDALPNPQECTGQLSSRFEEQIESLKKTMTRKLSWRRFTQSVVAAVLVVLLSISMLCAFNTKVRAAVITWIKEVFKTQTTFWYTTESGNQPQAYELTWVPDNYEIVFDNATSNSRSMVFQHKENSLDAFTFSYYLPDSDSPFYLDTFDGDYTVETLKINGFYGEFHRAQNIEDSNALIWFDEESNTVMTILAHLSKEDIFKIARNVEKVK